MKLSVWAKAKGVSYQTAWRWFSEGRLPVKAEKMPSGTIIVEPEKQIDKVNRKAVVYCRVSSYEKKQDLERQASRCISFCEARGWEIEKVIKEVGSGMNDSRKKLIVLLKSNPKLIVVEHKDRLTRFGFMYLETLLPMLDCELVVINRDKEEQSDLIKDLVAVVTSFCCRLYGMRRGLNKVKQCKKILL